MGVVSSDDGKIKKQQKCIERQWKKVAIPTRRIQKKNAEKRMK